MSAYDVLEGVTGFDWDNANVEHIARHNVIPDEAEDVFFDPEYVLSEDVTHSIDETRYVIIGKTQEGRILYQVFTRRDDKIRVISSRLSDIWRCFSKVANGSLA